MQARPVRVAVLAQLQRRYGFVVVFNARGCTCSPLGRDLYGDKFSSSPLLLPLPLRPAVPGRLPPPPPSPPLGEWGGGACRNWSGRGRALSLSVASTMSVSLHEGGGGGEGTGGAA